MRLRGRGYVPPARSRLFVNHPIPEAPRLTRDTSIAPSTFEHEGHRAIGAVVKQLLPACRRCAQQAALNLQAVLQQARDFEYWEHLGNGVYQLLHPDARLSDLHALSRKFPYRVFLGRFVPLQNTRRSYRRRGDGNRDLAPTRARSPASRSASPARSHSSSSSRESSSPSPSVLRDNPLDYDLEDELALPPSQQASSSRVPPPSARPSTTAGSTTRPSSAEANESPASLADLLRHSLV
ncbi:hypothetical protein C8R47DRAFT_1214849 [Mycena vitilis]|nr:hypothetical protein C8R47DRAFT_1214849 [Mycena vitilis]